MLYDVTTARLHRNSLSTGTGGTGGDGELGTSVLGVRGGSGGNGGGAGGPFLRRIGRRKRGRDVHRK